MSERRNRNPGRDMVRGIENLEEDGAPARLARDGVAQGTVIEVTPRASQRAMPSRAATRRRPGLGDADTQALNDLALARARLGINAFKKGGLVGAKTASIPVPGRQPGKPPSGVKPFGTAPMKAATGKTKPVGMPAMKKGGMVPGKKGVNPFAKKGK